MKIQLEWEDYLKANRLHLKPSLFLQIYFSILVIIFYVGAILFLVNFFNLFILMLLVFLILFVVGYRYLWLPHRTRKIFGQQKALQKLTEINFQDDGLTHTQELSQGVVPWEDLVGWRESDDIFMIYLSDVMFLLFPKRFFNDEDELDQLKEKLVSHGVQEYKKPANRSYTISAIVITLVLAVPVCQFMTAFIKTLLEFF